MELNNLGYHHLKAVLDSATLVSVISTTPEGVITLFNAGAERMLGYTSDEMVDKQTPAIIHLESEVVARGEVLSKHYGRPIEGFEVFVINALHHGYEEREWTYIRKDGEHIQVNLGVTSMRDDDGSLIGFLGVATDITKRKTAEQALAQKIRELDFQKMALDQHCIVSILDAQGCVTYANDRFCQSSGYQADELIGSTLEMMRTEFHSDDFYEDIRQTISAGKVWHGEIKNRRKDGGIFWSRSTTVPFTDETGKPFQYVTLSTDITARKKAEQELAESNERFQFFLDNVQEGVVLSSEGQIIDASDVWLKMFGCSREEVLGRSPICFVAEGDAERVQNIIDTEQTQFYEADLKRKDGSTFPALLRGRHFNFGGRYVRLATVRDITIHKETERALKQAISVAEEASRAKSEFLSSMSHELRTPLNAILGFSQMLQLNPDQPLTEEQQDFVEEITHGGKHLLDLINEILDLTKIEAGKMVYALEEVNLSALLADCQSLVAPMLEKHNITLRVGPSISASTMVEADTVRLKQCLLNLLTNAIKYNRPDGSVEIAAQTISDGKLSISVADTGEGIPNHLLKEMFEPFSRLRARNSEVEGTGIGLTITKQLVEGMGGNIRVDSEPGVGSTFYVDLPVAGQKETAKRLGAGSKRSDKKLGEGVRGNILYVEDNPANLRLMQSIVERIDGLNMAAADTAEEGIRMAEATPYDLIIMDINLPGMSGLEAVKELGRRNLTEHTPVIALSANAMLQDIERGIQCGFKAYLTKPIKVEEVVRAIKMNLRIPESEVC